MHLGRVQVAETVNFGGAEKSQMHASGLQQAHDAEHVQTLRSTENIWRIGHGVDEFGRWRGADHTVFKQADRLRSMGAFCHDESDERKAHADEHNFSVADFAGGGGDHQLAGGVSQRL
jgi:hypothetical protein